MIRVLMLDLGGTLVDENNNVFPFAREAVKTIKSFETEEQERLSVCLVSDFHMPTQERTVESIFEEYVSLLEEFDLLKFFKPVDQHVTLSTHAGVNKPDRHIFLLAIERLDVKAKLGECLFITENEKHIKACKTLGMQTLRFGKDDPDADFGDWSDAPFLITQIVNSDSKKNLEAVMKTKQSQEKHPDEEKHYIKTLDENKQISRRRGPLGPGETHRETVDKKGEKRIKRERFSAI